MVLYIIIGIIYLSLVTKIYRDARERGIAKNSLIIWMVKIVFFPLIYLPFYYAVRPLQPGEMRRGGVAWNFSFNFSILWTVFWLICLLFIEMFYILRLPFTLEIENIFSPLIIIIWIVPTIIVLILGSHWVIRRNWTPNPEVSGQ